MLQLQSQHFLLVKLKSSLRKFHGHHHDFVDSYGISVSPMTTKCSTCRKHFPILSSFMTYHRACNWTNTTSVTSRTGTAYPSGARGFTPSFSGVRVTRFYVCFVDRCLFLCTFFFLPLCCLFFFDIRIMINPLVSSNSSCYIDVPLTTDSIIYLYIIYNMIM